jgi:hypothetical protein
LGEVTVVFYSIDLRAPGRDPKRVTVKGPVSLGSDPKCEVHLEEFGLSPLHAKLKVSNQVLTITNLGGDGRTKIGDQALEQGRMYIIDKGDKVEMGEVSFIVRTDEEEVDEGALTQLLEEEAGEKTQDNFTYANQDEDEDNDWSENESTGQFKILRDGEIGGVKGAKIKFQAFKQKMATAFAGLKARFGAKEKIEKRGKKKTQKSIKVKKMTFGEMPGLLIRVIGMLASLSLVHSFLTYLWPIIEPMFELNNLIAPYLTMPATYLPKLLALIPPEHLELVEPFLTALVVPEIVKGLATFAAIDLLGHLLFGTSLPLFFAGVNLAGNPIAARIKAIFNAVLSWTMAPLLIFDLPLILGKRPLREVLTFSHLQYRSNGMKWFGGLILLPLIILAPLIYPLVPVAEELLEELTVNRGIATNPQAREKADFNLTAASSALGVKIRTKIPESVALAPTLESEGATAHPALALMDKKTGKTAVLARLSDLDLNDQFKTLGDKDPLLKYMAPGLYDFLENKKSSPDVELQINTIIVNSFTMALPTLHEFVLSQGVFFGPYLAMREKLIAITGKPTEIETFYAGRNEYMVVSSAENPNTSYIFGLTGLKLNVYRLTSAPGQLQQSALRLLRDSSLLSKALERNYAKLDKWTALDVLDLLGDVGKVQKLSKYHAERPYRWYFDLVKEAIQGDEKYQKELLKRFKELDSGVKKAKGKFKTKEVDELNYSLNRLQKALEGKEAKFFQLNR